MFFVGFVLLVIVMVVGFFVVCVFIWLINCVVVVMNFLVIGDMKV